MSIFTEIELKKPKSNTFDLSHDKKLSMEMGTLTPIHCQEIIPGDVIKMSTSQMVRMAPMIAPVMHRINIYTHFYFVPNRIIWPGWENFITGGEDGEDATVFPFVNIQLDNLLPGANGDYMGLPTENVDIPGSKMKISPLPFYGLSKIYNEYYRDQNLIDPILDEAIDGDNTATDIRTFILANPLKRAWAHDYFTSALPWTQKGPEATIPLGTSADIIYEPLVIGGIGQYITQVKDNDGNDIISQSSTNVETSPTGDIEFNNPDSGVKSFNIDNSALLKTDLSTATASSINDLRRAFKLQEWLELNARGGSRYIETILSHFGVRSSDARLQRPEFLGGGVSPITISEVLQTSDASAQETPQGNMAGHGISMGANNSFKYRAEEHGYIIGIMSVMPKSAYQQGIPKHFLKFDKFDYFWKSFAHIGEQPIQHQELYVTDDANENEKTFGYTPRYAEYKFINSSVHGEFRTTLDFWHMGRIFSAPPLLNEDFINCDPAKRIFAVVEASKEQLYCHVFHRIKARRLMPYFGSPKM